MSTAVDCKNDLQRYVPLMKVVGASIVDLHEDIGRLQQLCTHWGARGLKKLTRETLKTGIRKVTLTVNQNTKTAALPPDFDSEQFVGIINEKGYRVPLKLNNNIVDWKNIEDIPCEDRCPKCNQDKQICEDLTVTEETVLVLVNGITAQQTIIKKCYPDGTFYIETRIPVWDIDSAGIIYTTTKEFVAALDLKECGCIDDTAANIEIIKCLCPDVWCTYYAPCDNSCMVDYGGYRIFEESGLIYFDKPQYFEKVYLEYWGFMVKKNGQYQVPEVAFETLVNFIKFKWVENKRNIPAWERQWTFDQYRRERGNMEKVIGRIGLSQIIQSIGLTPKFDLDYNPEMWCSGSIASYSTVAGASAAIAAATDSSSSSSSSDTSTSDSGCNDAAVAAQECPCPTPAKIKTPFQLAVVAGVGSGPTPGTHVYVNLALKDALDVNVIIVNNTAETEQALQFTLDTTTGTLRRFQGDGVTPNQWQSGPPADVLIINYAKII